MIVALAGSLVSHGLAAGAAFALAAIPAAPRAASTAETPVAPPLFVDTITLEPAPAPGPEPGPAPGAAPQHAPRRAPIPLMGHARRAAPPATSAVPGAAATPPGRDAPAPATEERPVRLRAGLELRALPEGPGAASGAGGGGDEAGAGGTGRGAAPGSGAGAGAGAGDPITGRLPEPAREAYPLRRDRKGNLVYSDIRFTARIARDGTVTFIDRGASFDAKSVSMIFDVNDMIMRARGEDPYSYEKRKFLLATWDLRLRLRVAADAERLRTALRELPDYLEAIWRDARRPAPERRRLLYLLWEECDERSKGGLEARATIEGFVRRRLPPGSPEAFTPAELARLNAGGTAFAPYR